jgi:hypothetical protein
MKKELTYSFYEDEIIEDELQKKLKLRPYEKKDEARVKGNYYLKDDIATQLKKCQWIRLSDEVALTYVFYLKRTESSNFAMEKINIILRKKVYTDENSKWIRE